MLFLQEDVSDQARQMLLLEQPNLRIFLDWGYENERSDGTCYSARITALLADYLLKVTPSELEGALRNFPKAREAAVNNNDLVAEAYLIKGVGDLLKAFPKDIPNKLENSRQHHMEALNKLQIAVGTSGSAWEKANIYRARGDIYASLGDKQSALVNYRLARKFYNTFLPDQKNSNGGAFDQAIKDMLENTSQGSSKFEENDPNRRRLDLARQRLEIALSKVTDSKKKKSPKKTL